MCLAFPHSVGYVQASCAWLSHTVLAMCKLRVPCYTLASRLPYLHWHTSQPPTIPTFTHWPDTYHTYIYTLARRLPYLHLHTGQTLTIPTFTHWPDTYHTYLYTLARHLPYLPLRTGQMPTIPTVAHWPYPFQLGPEFLRSPYSSSSPSISFFLFIYLFLSSSRSRCLSVFFRPLSLFPSF